MMQTTFEIMTFTQILLLAAAAAVVAERAEPTGHLVTYEDLSANATAFAQLANWL